MIIPLKEKAGLIQFYEKSVKLLKDNPNTPEYRDWLKREFFSSEKVAYNPLKPFIWFLAKIDPKYRPYIKTNFTPEKMDEFLELVEDFRSSRHFRSFFEEYNRAIHEFNYIPKPFDTLTQEEIKALAEAENTPEEQDRAQRLNDFIEAQDNQPGPTEGTSPSSGAMSFPHSPPAPGGGGVNYPTNPEPPATGNGTAATNKGASNLSETTASSRTGFQPRSYTVSEESPLRGFQPRNYNLSSRAGFKVPGVAKDLGSNTKIGFLKLRARAPGFIGGFLNNLGSGGLGALGGGGQIFSKVGAGGVGGRLGGLGGSLTSNPKSKLAIYFLVGLFFFLALFMTFFQGGEATPVSEEPPPTNKDLTIVKEAQLEVPNPPDPNSKISYKITITYIGLGTANIEITDQVPENTTSVDIQDGGVEELDGTTKTITWTLTSMETNKPKTVHFTVQPTKPDIWVQNIAKAKITNGPSTRGAEDLLPTPLPPPPPNWAGIKRTILDAIDKNPVSVGAYKYASEITGVPWELLAGLHYVETGGSLSSNSSLVSGRPIGNVEPDIPISACARGVNGPGIPIPIGGGCGFGTFQDSAIYSANHLSGKINHVPVNFEDAVTALSRYNGGGNSNCGRGTPYSKCPPEFSGEDDPYSMAFFDDQHANMFLIYCRDGVKCSPPQPFQRPGSMAVVRALNER